MAIAHVQRTHPKLHRRPNAPTTHPRSPVVGTYRQQPLLGFNLGIRVFSFLVVFLFVGLFRSNY